MQHRQFRGILVLFLLASYLVLKGQVRAQTDSAAAPYLYYFSQSEHAIVIERADGTDHRVLAPGVMPTDHNAADLAWSPTGQWLAWRSWYADGYAPYHQLAWIISSDGKTRRTLLDGQDGIVDMQWSPKADWLAVSRLTDPKSGAYELYLINVEKNQVVLTAQGTGPADEGTAPTIRWTADGTRVFFYEPYWYEHPKRLVTVLSITGQMEQDDLDKQVTDSSPCAVYGFNSLLVPFWGNDKRVAYLSSDPTKLHIEGDVNDTLELDAPVTGLAISNFQWSPDGKYALLLGSPFCEVTATPDLELWLFSVQDHSLTLINTHVVTPYEVALCCDMIFGQFPDQMALPWSPTEDKAFFVTDDQKLHVISFAPFTENVIAIPGLKTDDWMAYWQPDGKAIFVEAQAQLNQPPFESSSRLVYRYTLSDKHLTLEPDNQYYLDIASRSADGQFIAYECKLGHV